MPRNRDYLPVIVLTVLIAVFFAVGFSARPKAEASSATTSTSTVANENYQILHAYHQFQAAYVADGNPVNPDDPMLAKLATGDEVAKVKESLGELQLDGDIKQGEIDLAPTLVSHTSDVAIINDCLTDASYVVKSATGARVGDSSTTQQLAVVHMTRVGNSWKVSAMDHNVSACVATFS